MPINAEQNQNDNQKAAADPNAQNPSTGAGATPTSGTSRVASYSSGVAPTQTGSGRFTNLQNYIGANQGASDRLASGISGNLDKSVAPVKKDADTQASNVREGIASAQNKLQTGQGYYNQVAPTNAQFDASSIANDPNKLQDFTNFRTNNAVGGDQLAATTNQAQTTTQNLQTQLQDQMKSVGTEQGRFNLLKNTFGGGSVYQNPYTNGQQRLDQLFLQAGGNDNVNKIQQGVRSNLSTANQLADTLGQQHGTVSGIQTNAADLANNLQSSMDGRTNNYVNDIAGTEAAVNKQRLADKAYAGDQYSNLQNGGAIDQNFANQFGINDGQHLYNSLTGKDKTNFMDLGVDQLHGVDQLANADQRHYYDSLAKLAGVQNYAITGKGDATTDANGNPIAAVAYKKDAFQQAQNDALKDYQSFLGGQDYSSTGHSDQYYAGHGGWGGDAGGTSSGEAAATLQRSTLANALDALGPGASMDNINSYVQNSVNPNAYLSMAGGDKEASRAAIQSATEQALGGVTDQARSGFDSAGFFKRAKILPKDVESGGSFGVR